MRPVNLLPEGQRPRGAGDSTGNGPKIAIGALAVLLLMVTGYVFTANQVSTRETEIAEQRAAADAAQARANALAPYAQLATVKQTRAASVNELAGGRFDWERLMREVAMVLPKGTWLSTVTASTGPVDGNGASSPPEPGAADAGATPTVKLDGCAPSQPGVATLLVRLRKLHGVTDVQLGESRREESDGEGAAASDAASGDSCGRGFTFNVTVTFEPPVAVSVGAKVERVPAALGGGQ